MKAARIALRIMPSLGTFEALDPKPGDHTDRCIPTKGAWGPGDIPM